MHLLNNNIMWDAVVQCNEEFDGLFIYAVKSTGICCRPSCKSRTPLKANISFYDSISSAMENGYRPCKRCRPELIQSNEEEIISSAKLVLEQEYRRTISLDQLALKVGVSKFHLQRLFKKCTGISPLEYVTNLRISEAIEKLQTEDSITDIAYQLGFKSSSHFSSVFRNQTGYTPSEYRKGAKI